jgi:hypothetical protein
MAGQKVRAARRSSAVRTALKVVFSLVLVFGIFYYLLTGVDLGEVWAEIRSMTWREDLMLAAVAAWNLATYAFVWMSVTPGR